MLAACDLPFRDLTPAHMEHFWVARDGPRLAGAVGLEIRGDAGLLRSLCVAEADRGQGIGGQLTEKAEEYARARGLQALYLLTTTASDFFARRGYQWTERAAAPAPIQETSEFQSLCPSTAVCMVKYI